MADFALLEIESQKLISRKIWLTEKSWNFHTVKCKQIFVCISGHFTEDECPLHQMVFLYCQFYWYDCGSHCGTDLHHIQSNQTFEYHQCCYFITKWWKKQSKIEEKSKHYSNADWNHSDVFDMSYWKGKYFSIPIYM